MQFKRCIGLTSVALSAGILLSGTAAADYYSYVYTPKGNSVSVFVMTSEFSQKEIAASDAKTKRTYPRASLVGSTSRKYNCHSYAWYNNSSNNNVWMNDPTRYRTDGSYIGYCSVKPNAFDKVYYPSNTPDNSHSAISLGGGQARSKWGQGPLMSHPINYGPKIYQMSCYNSYRR